MAAKTGRYFVQYTYKVDPERHPQLVEIFALLRDYADWLGMASYAAFLVEDEPWTVVEMHGYDSWSHCQMLAKKQPPAEIERAYEQLDALIEGGLAAGERKAWTELVLPTAE